MKWDNFSSQFDLIRHPVTSPLDDKNKTYHLNRKKYNSENWNKMEMREK